MNNEISDLGLFVQTSPYGLGLYKKGLGPIFLCTASRSVNKKLVIVITIDYTIHLKSHLCLLW
jgi:hypothetical protein